MTAKLIHAAGRSLERMKMKDERIVAWVTKYALNSGIRLLSGVVRHEISSEMFVSEGNHFAWHGKDWHRTPEAALARAEEMRLSKIESLKKSIKKMEGLKLIAPSVPINCDD